VFDEITDGECGVAQDFIFFIFESTTEEVEKVVSMGSNSSFHAVDDLSDTTNGGGTVGQRTVLFLTD
jgi:hypothetical protein